jgi:hypothetical protein
MVDSRLPALIVDLELEFSYRKVSPRAKNFG